MMQCEHVERLNQYLREICGDDWLAELIAPVDAEYLARFIFNQAHGCSWRRGALEVLGELVEARDFDARQREAWLHAVPPVGGVH